MGPRGSPRGLRRRPDDRGGHGGRPPPLARAVLGLGPRHRARLHDAGAPRGQRPPRIPVPARGPLAHGGAVLGRCAAGWSRGRPLRRGGAGRRGGLAPRGNDRAQHPARGLRPPLVGAPHPAASRRLRDRRADRHRRGRRGARRAALPLGGPRRRGLRRDERHVRGGLARGASGRLRREWPARRRDPGHRAGARGRDPRRQPARARGAAVHAALADRPRRARGPRRLRAARARAAPWLRRASRRSGRAARGRTPHRRGRSTRPCGAPRRGSSHRSSADRPTCR